MGFFLLHLIKIVYNVIMNKEYKPKLNLKKRYLQIALNSTLDETHKIINSLPISDRIIIEAGTPLIKKYGEMGIRKIKEWYGQKLTGISVIGNQNDIAESEEQEFGPGIDLLKLLFKSFISKNYHPSIEPKKTANNIPPGNFEPYIVADLKMMDRGSTEVEIAANAGASAAVALGAAPIESLDVFIANCENLGLDSMIDMMNVEFPLSILRKLKKIPTVVILHRGVDEEKFNKEKQLPLHEIRRIKGNYDIMIAIAGGDSIREVQRAMFNDADIAVVWKLFYNNSGETANLAEQFLQEIK